MKMTNPKTKYTIDVSVVSGDFCGIQSYFTLKGEKWDNIIDELSGEDDSDSRRDVLLNFIYDTAEFQDAEGEVKSSASEELDEDDDRDDTDMSTREEISIINNETQEISLLL